MADPQDLSPLRAPPMHSHDRRLLAVFNWAGNVGGALTVGCYVAWAIDQMPLRFAAPGMAVGLAAMTGATIYALRERTPTKRSYFWPIMIGALALTWAVCGWQTWMWFYPPVQPVRSTQLAQNYTKAQLDEAVAKAKQDQLEQDKKDAAQQNADAVAKAIAPLRAQIAQLQSDTPVSVDKLPTSLRVLFNNDGTYTQLEQKNIAAWQPINLWDGGGLLVRPPPIISFVIVFKKAIAFDDVQIDGHNTGMIGKATTTDPTFIIVSFNASLIGLVDIAVQNKRGK